ncbi:Acetyltransferase (GNAT) family protein [Dethiosulfatibacter aminovorans DSM 17477]|uniref:Acetyltransferase (GNAT) family protein n=1 Tax=Dethiosulfatibacter aminovorans DSM 17477 TaxID=1121476 RepID=A0A1M6LB98_9FIRM|nr:GNAT family N-acetyltransferase [Dethiosulfatibacter aminovorans]SHJ68487.1 Acetyltransferase (GNAT) family protein [Dethiosulfatibacter aminovorans DSM 17477]
MIVSFSSLDERLKEEALNFILSHSTSLYYGDIEDRKKYLTGGTFEKGENLKFYYENSKFIGSIGIVTSEISLKKEGYITEINVSDKSLKVFGYLLEDAVSVCKNAGAAIITLGLKPHNFFLADSVMESNFIRSYSFIKLVHNRSIEYEYDNLVALNKENAPAFAEIMTSSFLNTPNGGSLSVKEAYELLDDHDNNKYGLLDTQCGYVGVYELRITGKKGWIDSIGIKPSCQHKGYGKMLLNQTMGYLYSLGVEAIEMMVADSNTIAYELYLKTGFEEKEVLSTWYKLSVNS